MSKVEKMNFRSAIAALHFTIPDTLSELQNEVNDLREAVYDIPEGVLVKQLEDIIVEVEAAAGGPGVQPDNFAAGE